ncbi:hypothetical protein LOTGIDRAFT_134083 [Lottia gigantea]|uniref:mRNA m(6)A methyltransferase n=1 Tax=Lottia gigantea TaxID=225164 RepID=V3ZQ95_LOTGI|nr:hypothetical protein LOTGIDRAFT_134083 [Lottia gigantea]ESO83051.1 hypothetical protein LOTGIDRAFT_134083 [Lottia gigantea]
MSDTWSDIQAVKTKQSSLRAKLAQRKKEREGLAKELNLGVSTSSSTVSTSVVDPEIEKKLPYVLTDINLEIPAESTVIKDFLTKSLERAVNQTVVDELLEKFAAQQLIRFESLNIEPFLTISASYTIITKIFFLYFQLSALTSDDKGRKRKREDGDEEDKRKDDKNSKQSKKSADILESLLTSQSAKEKENKKVNEEILQILSKPTAKEQYLVERFKSRGGVQLKEFCQVGTREECRKMNNTTEPCSKLHFRKIIHKHTDESLGDCSFLNTCFHMESCKYVHYEIDYPDKKPEPVKDIVKYKVPDVDSDVYMFPPQWIQCDLRIFDMTTIGKCAIVMADPPWDIHMELPYGTMSDDEMRRLDVPGLQDEGFIFLWVTGRAMELGRECLELWGYKRIDELIWVKTNQLQRIIRTGRTGHWLNHGKEHCLVGVKGNPKGANKGLDCDILVAEVRATSHKPDEIYGIIERLSPGTRKVELFGRPHNVQPNWITLGNQVDGVRLKDPDVVKLFKERYPDGNCMEPPKPR